MNVFVISWSGYLEAATQIAEDICTAGGDVAIVHSQGDPIVESPPTNISFITVSNQDFFGRKFCRALEISDGRPFLLVQADARCSDWGFLFRRFENVMKKQDIGLWSPEIEGTPWSTAVVAIRDAGFEGFIQVSQTDAIVLGFSQGVIRRLKQFDYSENNLGWGIDWAAIAVAMSRGMLVVRDQTCLVSHNRGSGYSTASASKQQDEFLEQLSPAESAVLELLQQSHQMSRRSVKFALRVIDWLAGPLSGTLSFRRRR